MCNPYEGAKPQPNTGAEPGRLWSFQFGYIRQATHIPKAPSLELVNVRGVCVESCIWLRQTSPNFARLRQSSHEGERASSPEERFLNLEPFQTSILCWMIPCSLTPCLWMSEPQTLQQEVVRGRRLEADFVSILNSFPTDFHGLSILFDRCSKN